jgi:SAM-dependent methyltransferase
MPQRRRATLTVVMVDEVVAYVRAALPAPPVRVLEVGAGDGALARALRSLGFDITAIDPASDQPDVLPVALAQLDAEPGSFDAAVAVLSLHHVEPLDDSCRRLAEALPARAPLVIDEFDVARLDEAAAAWWIAQRQAAGADAHGHTPISMVSELRGHLHALTDVLDALAPSFTFGEPVRGPYLYRWGLHPAIRPAEEAAIAAGQLPATGARLVARRR